MATQNQPKAEAKAYQVEEAEKGYVHARIVRQEYDPKTGKQLFEPFIHKVNPQEWNSFLKYPNGYSVLQVLHAPAGTALTLEALEAREARAKKQKQ